MLARPLGSKSAYILRACFWKGHGSYRLRKNWFAANRPSIPWGASNRVIHHLAPPSLLRRVFRSLF
jgi:hypothetical protein